MISILTGSNVQTDNKCQTSQRAVCLPRLSSWLAGIPSTVVHDFGAGTDLVLWACRTER